MDGLKELILQRFDGVDARLDALTAQVKETNGRLRQAETSIADFRPRVGALEREMGEVRDVADSHGAGENRGLRVWDVTVFVAGAGVLAAALKLLRLL